jgi:hypothetical protein
MQPLPRYGKARFIDLNRPIDGRGSDCLTAGKLAPGNLGLLQQYLPEAEVSSVMPLPGTMHAT